MCEPTLLQLRKLRLGRRVAKITQAESKAKIPSPCFVRPISLGGNGVEQPMGTRGLRSLGLEWHSCGWNAGWPLSQLAREVKKGTGGGRKWKRKMQGCRSETQLLLSIVIPCVWKAFFAYANEFILPQLHSNQEQITFLLFTFSILN